MTKPLPHPDEIAAIEDPIARARAAYEAIDIYNAALHEASKIRRDALWHIIADNRTLEEAGTLLGISRQSVYRAVTMDRPASLADNPQFVAWVEQGEDAAPDDPDLIQPFLRPGENWQRADHRERGRRKAIGWLAKQQAKDQRLSRSESVRRWLATGEPPRDSETRQWAARFLPDGTTWDDEEAVQQAARTIKTRFNLSR